jgi:hypothetical protein
VSISDRSLRCSSVESNSLCASRVCQGVSFISDHTMARLLPLVVRQLGLDVIVYRSQRMKFAGSDKLHEYGVHTGT